MSDIFLSYKSEDRPRAKIIAEALEKYGYSVWLDLKISPGKTYDELITEALGLTNCVVVLWSKESIKLKEGKWVRTEATIGERRGILVPILIDDVEPPLAFMLTEAAKLIDWDGTLPNSEFDLLVKSIGEITGKPPALKKRTGQEEEGQQHREEEARRLRKEEQERKEIERKVRAEKERKAKEEEARRLRKEEQERKEIERKVRAEKERKAKEEETRGLRKEEQERKEIDSKAPLYIAIILAIIIVSIIIYYSLKFFGIL